MSFISEGIAGGDSDADFYGNPIWCNSREFATKTELPDGTVVQIGGEHEDSYDPEFMVHNDVIVYHLNPKDEVSTADGKFEIFGYPQEVFPKTVGHTATLAPAMNAVLIVDNMSAPQVDKDITAKGSL
jgi:hypothetical protein